MFAYGATVFKTVKSVQKFLLVWCTAAHWYTVNVILQKDSMQFKKETQKHDVALRPDILWMNFRITFYTKSKKKKKKKHIATSFWLKENKIASY
jgi:hypothetical protein